MNFKQSAQQACQQLPHLDGLGDCANLDNAFRFLENVGYKIANMDLLTLDEFTLDVVFAVPDSEQYLVIGAS